MFMYCDAPEAVQEIVNRLMANPKPLFVLNKSRIRSTSFCARVSVAQGIVADFDGTLIDGSQWPLLLELLDAQTRARNDADFLACATAEEKGALVREQEQMKKSLADLRAAGLTRRYVEGVGRGLRLREGGIDLLESFPLGRRAIVSWGIHDLIRAQMKLEAGLYTDIHATELDWDTDGFLSEDLCKEDTIVTQANKGTVRDRLCWEWGVEKRQLLVLADGPTDRHLFSPDTLSILVISPNDNERRMQARMELLPHLFNNCHAILFAEDLSLLTTLRN